MNPEPEENYEYYSLSPEEQWRHPMPVEIRSKKQVDLGPDGLPIEFEPLPDVMKVYDIRPLDYDRDKYPVPVMFVPGWSGTAEGFKRNILSMADLGRRTLSFTAVHGINPTEEFPDFPEAEVRKMSALMMALNKKDLSQVDIVTHSEGAIFSTMAATAHPERFRNLILISPAGLTGEDNWRRLLAGFTRDAIEQHMSDIKDERQAALLQETIDNIKRAVTGRSNLKMSLAEVQAIIQSHIEKLLVNLKDQGHGIIIIHPAGDHEFPIEKMAGRLDKKTRQVIPGVVTSEMVHGFLSVRGHHREMLRDPERYSRVIHELLTTLEKRQQ